MTRKQMALLIGINAVVSAAITLLLVIIILPRISREVGIPIAGQPATAASPGETAAPAAAEPVASPTPIVHIVRSGDTISGLALDYEVSEEDIVAANQLQNPDFLQVGAKLLIPVGGVQSATPTWTPVPTASDTPLPFNPPSVDMTATAEVAASGTLSLPVATLSPAPGTGELRVEITEVIGAGQAAEERVLLTNLGERLADLQGWTLSDNDGNTYTFPNVRLWPGGSVTVYTHSGQDGSPPNSFYWNKLVAIWSPGEPVTLKDSAGQVISSSTVGR